MHEIKNEILQGYNNDFELNGKKKIIGPIEHKTKIRFKNMDDFERYINAIDIDYDSEDVTFTGYVYKLDTPQFKVVKRSAYSRGIICTKSLNIMDKTVIYQLLDCVLSNILNILLKNFIQKSF